MLRAMKRISKHEDVSTATDADSNKNEKHLHFTIGKFGIDDNNIIILRGSVHSIYNTGTGI